LRGCTIEDVLDAWFSLPHKDARDDARVRERLTLPYRRAKAGERSAWRNTPRGRLALILLFDQVPRHLFRDSAEQYATDERARRLARPFVEEGVPGDFDPLETFYAVLPYLHAEDLQKQRAVNPVIHEVAAAVEELDFMGEVADQYLETIERFGRFPHRNEILGRESTPEEIEFLREEASAGPADDE